MRLLFFLLLCSRTTAFRVSRTQVLRGAAAVATTALSSQAAGADTNVVYTPPAVTTTSSPAALALAKHLKKIDAKLYGAYWCTHCYDQKKSFGEAAVRSINYVECAADGYKSARATCQEKGIKGYPTWEINGELYPGDKEIDELAKLSGFKM